MKGWIIEHIFRTFKPSTVEREVLSVIGTEVFTTKPTETEIRDSLRNHQPDLEKVSFTRYDWVRSTVKSVSILLPEGPQRYFVSFSYKLSRDFHSTESEGSELFHKMSDVDLNDIASIIRYIEANTVVRGDKKIHVTRIKSISKL